MKKLLTILIALFMLMSISSCDKKDEPTYKATAKNNYNDFINAQINDELELIMSVQAHQSWWDNTVTIYGQDNDGGYFVYCASADEETAKKLVPGTLIKVTGTKSEWSGELELVDATFEILDEQGKVYDYVDYTDIMKDDDELIKHMNEKVTLKNLDVIELNKKDSETDPDLYITVTANGKFYDLCVENYLTGPETEVYKTAETLGPGDVIDIEGFLYWYNFPNPHVMSITIH